MRILVIDDESALHDAYRAAFAPSAQKTAASALSAMASALFDDLDAPAAAPQPGQEIEMTSATQGLDAVELVRKSLEEGRPYQVAFIDIRMPPGIDGQGNRKAHPQP